MNEDIVVRAGPLAGEDRFSATALGESADAVGVAAGDAELGAGVGQSESGSAGGAAIAGHEHGLFRKVDALFERHANAVDVGIGATPLAGFAPDGIDCANAAAERVERVEVADDALFVGDGDAEALEREAGGEDEEILQLQRTDQKREIQGGNAAGLEGAIVNGGGDGVAHRVGDDAEDLAGLPGFFDAIEMAQGAGGDLAGGGALGGGGSGIGKSAAEDGREHAAGETGFRHGQKH